MARGSTVAALGLVLSGVVGCGSDCESWCEDTLDCLRSQVDDDALEEAKSRCDEACDELEEQAEDAGCEDAFDEYLACVEEKGDVCDGSPKCASKQSTYGSCIAKYCNTHPSAQLCGGPV